MIVPCFIVAFFQVNKIEWLSGLYARHTASYRIIVEYNPIKFMINNGYYANTNENYYQFDVFLLLLSAVLVSIFCRSVRRDK